VAYKMGPALTHLLVLASKKAPGTSKVLVLVFPTVTDVASSEKKKKTTCQQNTTTVTANNINT
jgi:hypothetical protein